MAACDPIDQIGFRCLIAPGVATNKLYPSRTKSSVIRSRDYRHVLYFATVEAHRQLPCLIRSPSATRHRKSSILKRGYGLAGEKVTTPRCSGGPGGGEPPVG